MRPMSPMGGGQHGGWGTHGAAPMRVADQGGWHERAPSNRAPEPRRGDPAAGPAGNPGGIPAGSPYGNGFGSGYRNSPITPVSAQTREVPHPPADSPVRTGSIREDVARYNEERGSYRPYPRNGGDVPRPPMPSPYRN
jgi:hypothetical protein